MRDYLRKGHMLTPNETREFNEHDLPEDVLWVVTANMAIIRYLHSSATIERFIDGNTIWGYRKLEVYRRAVCHPSKLESGNDILGQLRDIQFVVSRNVTKHHLKKGKPSSSVDLKIHVPSLPDDAVVYLAKYSYGYDYLNPDRIILYSVAPRMLKHHSFIMKDQKQHPQLVQDEDLPQQSSSDIQL